MSGYHYDAPLRSMCFVIDEVLAAPALWREVPAWADLDMATTAEVLRQAARFASDVLQPLNAQGDRQGCRLDGAQVRTPDGFPQAWQAFVAGGWPALACDPALGGQGLPQLLNAALFEMLVAANHGWTMYPGLLHGAVETIQAHGSADLRQNYLPKLVSGEWLAAMALTEPQAGSDLGQVATRAQPQPDGSLRVSGSKIFISGGDHDLSANIVHLVLCRLPDAPAGSKGLSLALVPKVLPDGSTNAMACDGVEHKLGIHASATCVMRYDGATGWLVGQPQRGLAAMFLMMNAARLHVGLQGLGHLEMASQNARRQALERVQMRQPIARHPAMRRLLRKLQAESEGLRVLAYRAALRLDESDHHPDPARRAAAAAEAALLTPVIKAFGTQLGFDGASAALQVWGGSGYVRDFGIEQTLRDSRIALIYEGTNEIQAIDLLQRKVLGAAAPAWDSLLDGLAGDAGDCPELAAGVATARDVTARLRQLVVHDAEAPLRVADDFLAASGLLLLAWAWAVSVRAAARHADAWHQERADIARHGLAWLLPQSAVHWQRAALALPLGDVLA